MRRINEYTNGNKCAKVYKDLEWDEFRVKLFVNGKHQREADYHTDDQGDAEGTAQEMIK